MTVLPKTIYIPHKTIDDRKSIFEIIANIGRLMGRSFFIQIREDMTLLCFDKDWLPSPNGELETLLESHNFFGHRVCAAFNLHQVSPSSAMVRKSHQDLDQYRRHWGIEKRSDYYANYFRKKIEQRRMHIHISMLTFLKKLKRREVEVEVDEENAIISVKFEKKVCAELFSIIKERLYTDTKCYILPERIVFLFDKDNDFIYEVVKFESDLSNFPQEFQKQFKFLHFKRRDCDVIQGLNTVNSEGLSNLDQAILEKKSSAFIFELLESGFKPELSTLNYAKERDEINLFKLLLFHKCNNVSDDCWSLRTEILETWIYEYKTRVSRGSAMLDNGIIGELDKASIEREMFHSKHLTIAGWFLKSHDEASFLEKLKNNKTLASQILLTMDLALLGSIKKVEEFLENEHSQTLDSGRFQALLLLTIIQKHIGALLHSGKYFRNNALHSDFWSLTRKLLEKICFLGEIKERCEDSTVKEQWRSIAAFILSSLHTTFESPPNPSVDVSIDSTKLDSTIEKYVTQFPSFNKLESPDPIFLQFLHELYGDVWDGDDLARDREGDLERLLSTESCQKWLIDGFTKEPSGVKAYIRNSTRKKDMLIYYLGQDMEMIVCKVILVFVIRQQALTHVQDQMDSLFKQEGHELGQRFQDLACALVPHMVIWDRDSICNSMLYSIFQDNDPRSETIWLYRFKSSLKWRRSIKDLLRSKRTS